MEKAEAVAMFLVCVFGDGDGDGCYEQEEAS